MRKGEKNRLRTHQNLGQLAGAYYAEDGIAQSWRGNLAKKELIESLADRLFALSARAAGS